MAYSFAVCYLWVLCNKDKCCVVTQRAADICVAWLVYARTYCGPIATSTLNQNKPSRLLLFGRRPNNQLLLLKRHITSQRGVVV